ncbi:MAG: exodeoxyribonuclease VII large subunit [bacterium]
MPITEFSVSQFLDFLNDAMRAIVDPSAVAIIGEVAEFKVSQGKWVWFKLKDDTEEGVLDCFWTTFGMREPLEDGMKIRACGVPKVHPRSGKFSFNITRVELVGEGALKRSYELLKKKLTEEGLFDPARKRAIPKFPERIGLITSREAAACTDFLRILGNRFGGVAIQLASVAVQGEHAISEIVGAFKYFNNLPEEDRPGVLVLTRGGGSMEDMKAFNSEEVARAVYSSKIPVVCGVGHERDESLADFAADVRASTPSNAAERVVPDRRDLGFQISVFTQTLENGMLGTIRNYLDRVMNSVGVIEKTWSEQKHRFELIVARLNRACVGFGAGISRRHHDIERIIDGCVRSVAVTSARFMEKVSAHERLLSNMNPELQLKRGWSVVRTDDGTVLRDASGMDAGDRVSIRLWRGDLKTVVTEVKTSEQSRLL